MKKEKMVVTGGAGFIGSNIVNRLVEEGYEVHVVDNLSEGKKEKVHKKAKLHVVDIRETKKLKTIFKNATCVFHLAALPRVQFSIDHPEESHDVNVNGTLSVLLAARDAQVKKLVYSASSSAYGDQKIMPLTETMLPNPQSPYGLHKHIGELYARVFSEVYNLPTVSLRYFNVYGPGQSAEGSYPLVIAKFLKQKKLGKPLTITGDGKQTRDFTHVFDVVDANIRAMKSQKVGKGEVFNIGAGKNISVKDIARMIGGKIEYIPKRLEPKNTLADNSQAQKILGWKPQVTLKAGIDALLKNNE